MKAGLAGISAALAVLSLVAIVAGSNGFTMLFGFGAAALAGLALAHRDGAR